jgi:hypothetical protein
VIGPKSAAALQAFVDAPQPGLPRKDQVGNFVGKLRMALPGKNMSVDEGDTLLEQYWLGLNDVPLTSLHHAYATILREDSWFPTIARVREAASQSSPYAYRVRKLVAETLLMKHRNEWSPPVEEISPEDMAQLRRTISEAVSPKTDMPEPSRRAPVAYCPTCHFSLDNPAVDDCRAPNCGKDQ